MKSYNNNMNRILLVIICCACCACNSLWPYKSQSLNDLHRFMENPQNHQGKIVSFSGTLRGLTENIHRIKLVLKVETPLYYYATGKDPLSYQLLLVTFKKEIPEMSNLKTEDHVKILARIQHFETRTNSLDKPIGVLHLEALSLTDRTRKKDFFHTTPPDWQLYQSWKAGRLFFKETPQQIVARFPIDQPKKKSLLPKPQTPPILQELPPPLLKEQELIFEEEEPFIIPQE